MGDVGVLHPGEMGASVAGAAVAGGATVRWASAGRSAASRRRAESAGLVDGGDLGAVAEASDIVVSVCPPDAALELADAVLATGFRGIYADANAVSTVTADALAARVAAAGARFVDGGIIGPPAQVAGTTRLYLSGEDAGPVAEVFAGTVLEAIVIGPRPGAASALKMAYAAWTKGSAALLAAIRALAEAEGVEEPLLGEWAMSQAGLATRSEDAARGNAFKAWRFAGEMREIAATFEAAGLPGGFHQGAAEVYERLAAYKDCDPPPELAAIIESLLRRGG